MSPSKRIFINVIATYGRSLFALVCGLFTSRWVLMSLGAVDYGLYGLVGGIIGFVTFINTILSLAVARFYAFEVGKASKTEDAERAIYECRSWFSTAVFLHSALPLILVSIGWPIGEYAVHNWLTIPADRLDACLWVFRFSIVSCFVGMVSVPFNAMYTAKQYIAELTIYSVAATTVRVVVLYYMVTHPGDWLFGFGMLMMLLSVVPNLIIVYRACLVFPECRLIFKEMIDRGRIGKLGSYAGWEMFGMTAWTCRQNGTPIFINEFLGPEYNSSMTIANVISGHTMSLSSCLTGAFSPAITSQCGAGNVDQMRLYAFRATKIGTFLMLVFAVPIGLELDEIVKVWLVNPPSGVVTLSRYVLITLILDRLAAGQHMAVCANGNIGKYQVLTSIGIYLYIPIVWLMLCLGVGVHAVGIALVVSFLLNTVTRAWCAFRIVDMSFAFWIRTIVFPVVMIVGVTIALGLIPMCLWAQSIPRVFGTGFMVSVVLLVLIWFFGLDCDEKNIARQKLLSIYQRIRQIH